MQDEYVAKQSYILAIDEGTTGTTSLLINGDGQVVSKAYQEVHAIYPQPGWVEEDAQELFQKAISGAHWDRDTGKPAANAIVWQCRRTAAMCEELKNKGYEKMVREKTGLVIDAYFSATKIRWILDHIPDGQKRAERGDLLFGTVDSWLIWNLTGGAVHVTDYSNVVQYPYATVG